MPRWSRAAAVLAALTLTLVLGLTGAASAATPSPTPTSAAGATGDPYEAAAKVFCADGSLSTINRIGFFETACVQAAAPLIRDPTKLTADVVCAAFSTAVPLGARLLMTAACKPIAGKLVEQLEAAAASVAQVVGQVVDVVQFIADPSGALDELVNSVQKSAVDFVSRVMPAVADSTAFDASAPGFLRSYSAAAGLGVAVMALMLLLTAFQTARGSVQGDALARSVFQHAPTGLLLMIFAPAIAVILGQCVDGLTRGIISFTAQDTGEFLGGLSVFTGLSVAVPGGALTGLLLFGLLFAGTCAVWLGLLLQTVGLWLTGVVMAVSFGMWANPKYRRKALKVPLAWLGLLLAKPLLFLLLGAAFSLANTGASQALDSTGLSALAGASLAVLALLTAGLAPLALLKYAPLLPDGSANTDTGGGLGAAGVGAASGMMTSIAMNRAHAGGGGQSGPSPQGAGGGSGKPEQAGGAPTNPSSAPGRQESTPMPGAGQPKQPDKTGPTVSPAQGAASGAGRAAGQAAGGGNPAAAAGGAGAGSAGAGAAAAAAAGPVGAVVAGGELARGVAARAKDLSQRGAPEFGEQVDDE